MDVRGTVFWLWTVVSFSLSAQVLVFWVGPVRCALGSEAGVVMPFAVWFIDGHMFVCKGFVSV